MPACKSLINSDLYGFWLRLETMGFKFVNSEVTFDNCEQKTIWRFCRKLTVERVVITAGKLHYCLLIKQDGVKKLKLVATCYGQLELPFLRYFEQERKPLYIRRLGPQTTIVQAFQRKLQSHVKEGGRWAKQIIEMNILPPTLPPITPNRMRRRS